MTIPNDDKLPTCTEYARLISEANRRFGITKDEARNRYGLYTDKQWKELFNLKSQSI